MFLRTTLSTQFVAGTNLKGQVAGANWSYLLPVRTLEQIVCIGNPSAAAQMTLSQISRETTVVCRGTRELKQFEQLSQEITQARLRPVTLNHTSSLPLPDQSVDLVLIPNRLNLRWLARNRHLLQELRRLLKPGGNVYFESVGTANLLLARRASTELIRSLGNPPAISLWLTPSLGEARRAAPLSDRDTIEYLVNQRLGGPAQGGPARLGRRVARFFGRFRASRGHSRSRAEGSSPTAGSAANPSSEIRRARNWSAYALERAEAALGWHHLYGKFARRFGFLIGRASGDLDRQPPEYIREIARSAGVNLERHRWGFSASEAYSSRKLLFLLFDPATNAPADGSPKPRSDSPKYVVKMVREPIFNSRLENEYDALSRLSELGAREAAPQAVFFGYHAGLAILGQTFLPGAPFRERTSATVDCPFARKVTDWLTELAAHTADTTAVTAQQASVALETLLERFTALYHLSATQLAFLSAQIALIGQGPGRFPAVFQHGDPGPWNIIIGQTGEVAFLDWEAAEPQGMPLWDLFYFLRSYCFGASRMVRATDGLSAFAAHFLYESPFSSLILTTTERYCQRIGLPSRLVGPLFFSCWMHRALKEATRLPAERLNSGHYANVLRLCLDRHDAPTLARLRSI